MVCLSPFSPLSHPRHCLPEMRALEKGLKIKLQNKNDPDPRTPLFSKKLQSYSFYVPCHREPD